MIDSLQIVEPRTSDAQVERRARLEAVLDELERRFGPRVVYRLRDRPPNLGDGSISTSALSLDLATGIDGVPRGRITQIVGSGKSSLAFHVLAAAQRAGEFVAYIDVGHQVDAEQMVRCGIYLSDLLLAVPENLSEAMEIAALLIESGGLGCLVLGQPMGGRTSAPAVWPSMGLATLNAVLQSGPTAVLFLTEENAPPSRPLQHFASLRIHLSPLKPLRHPSGDILGIRIQAHISKNKLAPPYRRTELDLRRDRGLHREADLFDVGCTVNAVTQELLGLRFGDTILGRGRDSAIETLERDPMLAEALEAAIRRTPPW